MARSGRARFGANGPALLLLAYASAAPARGRSAAGAWGREEWRAVVEDARAGMRELERRGFPAARLPASEALEGLGARPLLIAVGAEDGDFSLIARRLAAGAPGARLSVVPGGRAARLRPGAEMKPHLPGSLLP